MMLTVETHTSAKNKPRRPLIEGRLMRCPRCKGQHDVLQYVPMRLIEEFALETTPIYKCPSCRWLFAPIDGVIHSALMARFSKDEQVEEVAA